MNYEYLPNLFVVISIVYLVMQLVILVGDKKGKSGYIINAIGIVVLLMNLIIYSGPLNNVVEDQLGFFFLIVLASIAELIVLLISFIVYRFRKERKRNIKGFFISICLFLLINYFVMFLVPSVIEKQKHNHRVSIVKEHLINAHGDEGFEIINWGFNLEDYGIISRYVVGYWFEVKHPKIDKSFFVVMDDETYKIENDYFLKLYYSNQLGLDYTTDISYDGKDYYASFFDLEEYIKKQLESKSKDKLKNYDLDEVLNSEKFRSDKKINTMNEIIEAILQNN